MISNGELSDPLCDSINRDWNILINYQGCLILIDDLKKIGISWMMMDKAKIINKVKAKMFFACLLFLHPTQEYPPRMKTSQLLWAHKQLWHLNFKTFDNNL